MLNSMRFKYESLDEIAQQLQKLSLQCRRRMILGFNFQFLQFNRLKQDFDHAIKLWTAQLETHNIMLLKTIVSTVPKTSPYGDCIFVFDMKEAQ
jgi:hypothetical protein